MSRRNLSRDTSGKILDTFDPASLRNASDRVGFMGVRTAADFFIDFFRALSPFGSAFG